VARVKSWVERISLFMYLYARGTALEILMDMDSQERREAMLAGCNPLSSSLSSRLSFPISFA
jgi:hypothetical protein